MTIGDSTVASTQSRGFGGAVALVAVLALAAACTPVHASVASGPPLSPAAVVSAQAPATVTVPAVSTSAAQTAQTAPSTPAAASADPSTSASTPPSLPPVAKVSATPALGSIGISPIAPITIAVAKGSVGSLTFTNPADHVVVKGTLSADKSTWTIAEPLGYGKSYTVAGTALGVDGKTVPIDGTYTTLTTRAQITTSISPGDGAVVGVAAPVIVRFGLNPTDKALIEKNVKITTTPKVEGSWAWITHDGDTYPSLDFRPKAYWPANTKVHVESDVYGLKFADGYYGGDDASADFTIGRNQVVIADAKTHQIVVQQSGKTVATYPASYGMGDNPDSRYGLNSNFVTRSGTYIVMDKQPKILMSNPKPGGGWYYHNVPEYWAVRISNDGEFIHENPDTVDVQGYSNVTHGCINLSESSAKAYYASAMYGDPVVVTGTTVQLSASDGDIYDWAIPWDTWLTRSALAPNTVIS